MSMHELLWSRLTLVWLLLVVATLISWGLGHGLGIADHRLAAAAVIMVALVKARFMIMEFMEIRHAPGWFKLAGEAWSAGLAAALAALILAV